MATDDWRRVSRARDSEALEARFEDARQRGAGGEVRGRRGAPRRSWRKRARFDASVAGAEHGFASRVNKTRRVALDAFAAKRRLRRTSAAACANCSDTLVMILRVLC
jgi:hypothetical protein